MDAKAITRYVRVSPRRTRYVADLIRGKSVGKALEIVRFTPTRSAGLLGKTLNSAVANAKAKKIEDVDSMKVQTVLIDGGPIIKRFRPRAMGRATPIFKRTSHITVVLSGGVVGEGVKQAPKAPVQRLEAPKAKATPAPAAAPAPAQAPKKAQAKPARKSFFDVFKKRKGS